MPDFDSFSDDNYSGGAAIGDVANSTPGQVQQAGQLTAPGKGYGFWSTLAGDVGLGAIDLADTVASSIPGLSRVAGTTRGVVNQKALNLIGSPGLTQFYNDNQGGIEVASGIVGTLVAEGVTRGIGRVAAPMFEGLKTLPYARRILALDTQYERSLASLRMVDKSIAARGLQGADAFRAAATVPISTIAKDGAITTSMQTVNRAALATKTRFLGAAKNLKSAAATEAVMATTLNSNNFLYPDDWNQIAIGYGLGLGIPSVIGAVGANYAMKTFLQSDLIARTRVKALDPSGIEQGIMGMFGKGANPNTYLGGLKGTFTDEATSYFVQADSKAASQVDQSTYNQLRLSRQQSGFVEAEKATQGGLMGLPDTRFKGVMKGETPEGNTVRSALLQDAGALYGVEMLGRIGDDSTAELTHMMFQNGLENRLSETSKKVIAMESEEGFDFKNVPKEYEDLLDEMKQLTFAKNTTPSLLTSDGERVPLSHGKTFENWQPNQVQTKKLGDQSAFESFDPVTGKPHGIAVQDNLTLHAKEFDNQGPIDRLRTFRVFRTAIKKLSLQAATDPKFILRLPDNPSWIQLDAAEQIFQKTDGRANIVFPQGLTRDSAQVESFAQKVEQMKAKGMDLTGNPGDVAKARMMYNLPQLTAYEVGALATDSHPMDYLARGAMSLMDQGRGRGNANPIRDMTLAELKDGFTQVKNINDLSQMSMRDVKSIAGKSFDYMIDEAGNELKPVLVYSRPLRNHDWFKSTLVDRLAVNKMQTAKALLTSEAPMVKQLASSLYSSADLELAGNLSKLHDLQLAPSTPGFGNVAPQSAIGSAMKSVSSQNWTARFSVPLQAMTRIRESMSRAVAGYTKDAFQRNLGDGLDRLAGPNSLETNSLLDQWMTPGVASGWDIQRNTIRTAPAANGRQYNGFVLEMTEANKARFQKQFGRELTQGQQLIGPNGKPVVMDDLGLQMLEGVRGLTTEHRINSNAILKSQGLKEIAHKEWYVPPPDLTGKYWAVTQDELGNPVPGGMIIADTERQLAEQIQKAKANPESIMNRPGHIVRKRQELDDFGSIIDRAQMELVDANEIWGKGGVKNLGLNAVGETQTGAFMSAIKQIRNNYHDLTSQILEATFSDEIKMAQHRAQLAAGEVATRETNFGSVTHRSTYDYWLQELRGQNPSKHPGSTFGPAANRVEATVNRILKETAPTASNVWHNMTDFMTKRIPWTADVRDRAAFDKLASDMGEYMPFKDVASALEQRGYKSEAKTLSEIVGSTSKFSSTWMLRMLEFGNAAMNMAGVVNALPAVSKYFTPNAAELKNTALYEARVGHAANIITTPSGGIHGVMDIGKLAIRGINANMKPDAFMKQFQEHTARLGMRNQEVAEFQRQLNSVESISSWKAFWSGDSKRTGFSNKGVVGWLSLISDKSEDFSRALSLDMGATLGRDLGIKDMDSLANFSHDFANRMIADYSPHNRPEVFQTALGAPFGLFQSYMWNYYERLFRYIEVGDAKSFAMQAAMQGTLFGAQTIPGFNAANSLFFNASEGESSPYDGMVHKFGHAAGSVLAGGMLGNVPQLFGVDAGVNFYTRGDTTPKAPFFSKPAAVSIGEKVLSGIGAAVDIFKSQNPGITPTQIGEILSNALPNRPLAGMFETLMAGGRDTDSYGQLVTENVSLFEDAARMLGLRSMRQSMEIDAYYQNKQMQEIAASKNEVLREGSRSLIRAEGEDALPKIYETYILNGGDERNFTRWYRDNYESATKTRASRRLEDIYSDPNKMIEVQRLMDAGVTMSDEENEQDPWGLTGTDPMNAARPTSDDTIPDYAQSF